MATSTSTPFRRSNVFRNCFVAAFLFALGTSHSGLGQQTRTDTMIQLSREKAPEASKAVEANRQQHLEYEMSLKTLIEAITSFDYQALADGNLTKEKQETLAASARALKNAGSGVLAAQSRLGAWTVESLRNNKSLNEAERAAVLRNIRPSFDAIQTWAEAAVAAAQNAELLLAAVRDQKPSEKQTEAFVAGWNKLVDVHTKFMELAAAKQAHANEVYKSKR